VLLKTRDNKIYMRLTMAPINPGRYTKLVLLADHQARYRPIRIDYHGRNKILFKSLNFHYGDILHKKSGRTKVISLPIRLEMFDLNSGMISRLEYFTLDDTISPEDAFFDPDFLGR